jgi:hypothetical protein
MEARKFSNLYGRLNVYQTINRSTPRSSRNWNQVQMVFETLAGYAAANIIMLQVAGARLHQLFWPFFRHPQAGKPLLSQLSFGSD